MIFSRKIIVCAGILLFVSFTNNHLSASQAGQVSPSANKFQQALTWVKSLFVNQKDLENKNLEKLIKNTASSPVALRKLIENYAGPIQIDEYEPLVSLPAPGQLVAFHNDREKLTSVDVQASQRGRQGKATITTWTLDPDSKKFKRASWSTDLYMAKDRFLLSGNGERFLLDRFVYDTKTGQLWMDLSSTWTYKPDDKPVCFNQDGTKILIAKPQNASNYTLIDTFYGRIISINPGETYWHAGYGQGYYDAVPVFGLSGWMLACVRGQSILCFNTTTGNLIKRFDNLSDQHSAITSLALDGDKSYFLYSSETETNQKISLVNWLGIQTTILNADKSGPLVKKVGFTNTGNSLYALFLLRLQGKRDVYQMKLWSMNDETGSPQVSEMQTLTFKDVTVEAGKSPRIAFSPNGSLFALGDDRKIELFQKKSLLDQLKKNQLVRELREEKKKELRQSLYQEGIEEELPFVSQTTLEELRRQKRQENTEKNSGYFARAKALLTGSRSSPSTAPNLSSSSPSRSVPSRFSLTGGFKTQEKENKSKQFTDLSSEVD